jgi:hypothetical protein
MTQNIFEKILEEKYITWNDMVTLTVVNPKYVKNIFNWSRQPKVLRFYEALGFHKNDSNVSLMTYDENVGRRYALYFSFDELIGIKKGK